MQDVKSLKALDGSYYDSNVNSETDTFTINETYAVFMYQPVTSWKDQEFSAFFFHQNRFHHTRTTLSCE